MKEMTIIITMAGMGTRFRSAVYSCPKYMIEVKGKSLFEWSLDSLVDYNDHVSKYIFIVRKEDNAKSFIIEKCIEYGIKEIKVVEIDYLTDGQATSCMLAIPYCDMESPIMVYNIDTYVEPHQLKYKDICGDGYIPCFIAQGDHWSFVRTDESGKVSEIREKQRISDNCTLGAYYFSSAKLYQQLYNEYYADRANLEKNEKYIAPLYNHMIKKELLVTISLIDFQKVHVLGTPEELEVFKSI